jgi:hypothetical protein
MFGFLPTAISGPYWAENLLFPPRRRRHLQFSFRPLKNLLNLDPGQSLNLEPAQGLQGRPIRSSLEGSAGHL